MKELNLNEVNEESENATSLSEKPKLTAGTYVGVIKNVTDCPVGYNPLKPESGDFLKLEIDIAEGEHAGHYQELYDNFGFWGLVAFRSYKPQMLNMFKAFIKTVKKSNPNFIWQYVGTNDEHALEGCKIGIELVSEDYLANDGSTKQKMKVKKIMTVDEAKAKTGPSIGTVVVMAPAPETSTEPDSADKIADDVPF